MSKAEIIKPYKKEYDYSYTSGAYGTVEILRARPELVRKVYIHSAYTGREDLLTKCGWLGVPVAFNDEAFRRINQKENSFVLGMFEKYTCTVDREKPHIVLVSPADMGNLGTIIRTMAGLNLTELAIIEPAADVFHPKTIRASMGALFHVNVEMFGCFEEYRSRYPKHQCFPFMLDGAVSLDTCLCRQDAPFALVFGNEAAGLEQKYAFEGKAIKIPQSERIDSLNLSVAVGIGAYAFASKNGLI